MASRCSGDEDEWDPVVRLSLCSPGDISRLEARSPLDLLPAETIYEALQRVVNWRPDRHAIIQLMTAHDPTPEYITYATYLERVERAANLFHHSSGDEEPVVGIVAPYLSEALVAMWAGATAGRYVPVNPYLECEHVAGILNAARVSVLVIATEKAGPGAWSDLPRLVAAVPTLQRVLRIGSGDLADDFALACADFPAGRLNFTPARTASAECGFMHTGGTTSAPKLVRHNHGGQLVQAWLCGMAMGSNAEEVVGHAMPNFHLGGAIAMGLRAIIFGQTLVTLTPQGFRNPEVVSGFWQIVERFGITSITTAPTTVAGLLAAEGTGCPSLRSFTTGGSALPVSLAKSFEERFGISLREVWGGTEFQGILSFHYGGTVPPRWGSCGRIIPYCDVVSAILEGNRFVRLAEPGERGTLIATGPTITPGFVDPGNDGGFFLEGGPDERTWATTGDIGHVDEDGFIWIGGRAKDVIIRGGHNIDSSLIDDALVMHPAVLHAAAVGKPCPIRGELPMAFVEIRAGATTSPADLMEFARSHIQERAAVPVEIVLIDAMPLTAVGKVFKPPLRHRAMEMAAAGRCAELCMTPVTVRADDSGVVIQLAPDDLPRQPELAEALAHFTFSSRVEPAVSFA